MSEGRIAILHRQSRAKGVGIGETNCPSTCEAATGESLGGEGRAVRETGREGSVTFVVSAVVVSSVVEGAVEGHAEGTTTEVAERVSSTGERMTCPCGDSVAMGLMAA